MGRQAGIARFVGTVGGVTCYFDDDKALARMRSSLDRERWRSLPSMAGQRGAARGFGAASVIASRLWMHLPAAMRRLCPAGGYGRLVGACRQLLGDDGQLYDADLLGPLWRDSSGEADLGVTLQSEPDGLQLHGLDGLLRNIAAATGNGAEMPARYVVAHGMGSDNRVLGADEDGVVREQGLEDCARFLQAIHGGAGTRSSGAPVDRRVRVWVYACKIVDVRWDRYRSRYMAAEPGCSNGFVTDWLHLGDSAAACYALVGPHDERIGIEDLLSGNGCFAMEDGEYVVFKAVEVAEKRGRHWVRLNWANTFRIDNGQWIIDNWRAAEGNVHQEGHVLGGVWLREVALPVEEEVFVAEVAIRAVSRIWDWAIGASHERAILEFKLAAQPHRLRTRMVEMATGP